MVTFFSRQRGKKKKPAVSCDGWVDGITRDLITGWVWCPHIPDKQLDVALFMNSEVLASARADQFRADLQQAGVGDGTHGFVLRLASKQVLSADAIFTVRVRDLDCIIPATPGVDEQLAALGMPPQESPGEYFLAVSHGIVWGWNVYSGTAGAPETMILRDDAGREVARATANLTEVPKGLGLQRSAGRGFALRLPPLTFDGQTHWFEVATGQGQALQNGRITIDGAVRGIGWIDALWPNKVVGWAYNYLQPGKGPTVEAFLRDVPLGVAVADQFRGDVAMLTRNHGFNGFTITFPRPLSAGQLQDLRLVIRETGTVLTVPETTLEQALTQAKQKEQSETVGTSLGCEGYLERIEGRVCTGWAVDLDKPHERLLIDLYLDGVLVTSTMADLFRSDLNNKLPTDCRHGFVAELPYDVEITPESQVKAFARTSNFPLAVLKSAQYPDPLGQRWHHVGPSQALARRYTPPCVFQGSIDLIVLNRNGAAHLEAFFTSFAAYNTYQHYRIVVVDHASSDESYAVCRRWGKRLHVKFLHRPRNYSFSESNNYAADRSNATYVCFINNDIIFCQDILGPMQAYFVDPAIDILGVCLDSPPLDKDRTQPTYTQHLGVQFSFRAPGRPILAYELPRNCRSEPVFHSAWRTPVVTAGMMVMRRTAFANLGGFHEGYFYGYEDVDLCLAAYARTGRTAVCANDIVAWHQRGASRAIEVESKSQQGKNKTLLERRFGQLLAGVRHAEWMAENRLFQLERLSIAFLVSGTNFAAPEADFFTAHELGEALSAVCDVEITYLDRPNWKNLECFDVVVALLHDCNLPALRANPHQILVGWPRNQFEKWLALPWLTQFDAIWCGSNKAAEAFSRKLHRTCPVLRIATNAERFENPPHDPNLAADYVFTGSFFNAPRQFMTCIRPDELPYSFALYGHNWNKVGWLSAYNRGALSYERMPAVYGSTKIVIDDANHTVAGWGSVNSRVFDALAAGALVVTNGRLGSEEVFDGLLPVYSDADSLRQLLTTYLEDEPKRQALMNRLRAKVLRGHTYAHRAADMCRLLQALGRHLRLGLRLGEMAIAQEDGGLLARLVTKAVDALGHRTRCDAGTPADRKVQSGDDAVLDIGDVPALSIPSLPAQQRFFLCTSLVLDEANIRGLFIYDQVVVLTPELAETVRQQVDCPVEALFPDAADFAAATVRRNNRAWSIGDQNAFVHRLEDVFSSVFKTLAAAQNDWSHAPMPERYAQPEKDAPIVHDGNAPIGHVFFFPDYRATNPYQTMMYTDISAWLDIHPGNIDTALTALRTSGSPVVFHLHWTSVILGSETSREATQGRVDDFLERLRTFVAEGGSLVWTVHNTISHDSRFADIEAGLCQVLADLASCIHVHDAAVPELVAQHYSLPPEKVLVGPHGHYQGIYPDDLSREEARQQLGLPAGAVVFLFFGQIRGYKGLEALVDAFVRAHAQAPADAKPWLVVAGNPVCYDPEPLRRVAQTCPELRLVLREIPDDELQQYFRAADFSVLPYQRVLTSGSIYLALSFGVPVIAPRLGFLATVAQDGENGLFYDPEAEGALEDVLTKALRLSAPRRGAMAVAASQRAGELGWETMHHSLARAFAAGTIPGCAFVALDTPGGQRRVVVRRPLVGPEFTPRVAVIILHYAHPEDTIRAAASVLAQNYTDVELYLVSNNPDPEVFCALSAQFPQAVVVQSPDNLGYAGGNNLGLLLARQTDVGYALLLNPDAVLGEDALRQLVYRADANPQADIFGPRIVFGDRPGVVWFADGRLVWDYGLQAEHLGIGFAVADLPSEPVTVDYVTGACLFVRSTLLERIGLLPEEYFLYFEETDWCLRAREAGAQCLVFPDIEAVHYKRSEEGGRPSLYFLYYYCRGALLMALRHQPGQLEATASCVREKGEIWLRLFSASTPGDYKRAAAAIAAGLADGHAGITGRVDLEQRIADAMRGIA